MRLPAICENCGRMFPSSFSANNSTMFMIGSKSGPCPFCGGMGDVPDGKYDVIDNIINVTALTKLSKVQLLKIRDDLQNAKTIQEQKDIIKRTPYGQYVEKNENDFDFKNFMAYFIIFIEVIAALNNFKNSLTDPNQEITVSKEDVIEYMVDNQIEVDGGEIHHE